MIVLRFIPMGRYSRAYLAETSSVPVGPAFVLPLEELEAVLAEVYSLGCLLVSVTHDPS
jgi:hypothetical protein